MAHKPGWVYTLRWGSPYTTPPNGLPRILGTWTDREPTTEDFLVVYPAYRLGCGFGHHISFPEPQPRRKLDAATNDRRKQRARMTAEANRVRKTLPLLADVIIRDNGLDWRQTQAN